MLRTMPASYKPVATQRSMSFALWYRSGTKARQSGRAFVLIPYLQEFSEWRDPDSNRGHHDFQSVYVCTALCRYFLTDGLNRRNLRAPGRRKAAVYRRMPPTLSSKLSSI